MLNNCSVVVIMPALNEADSLSQLDQIPDYVDSVIVVDNGSTDQTQEVAAAQGARVILEPKRGYGRACLTGIAALPEETDIVVFLDADFCDDPGEIAALCEPICQGQQDFVLASRMNKAASSELTFPQRFGNRLASWLMNHIWGSNYTDLGPFRAIRRTALSQLGMKDEDFGWTVEMQIKARRQRLRTLELPMTYRPRHFGKSKVSGTVTGVCQAGSKILWVIGRSLWQERTDPSPLKILCQDHPPT